MQITEITT